MEQKKLEPGSEYNEADTNRDGVVSDKELLAMEKLHQKTPSHQNQLAHALTNQECF